MQRYCPKCFSRFEGALERCPEDGEKLILMADQDLIGRLVDERYKVLSKLGEGGMGTVYIAEQAMIGRRVALKVLKGAVVQDESSVKRFLTEARAIAALISPHTITLHDFGVTGEGLLYYTMELLNGAPLSKVIKDDAPMDWARSARLMLQVCRSLEEAHNKGILHRDLKPDNLFITWGPDGEHVTVLDFGIAKLADPSMETITKTGMICGTPAYLSPEQAQGYPAVPASDLYALGIVLYEMLAGEPPFSDTTAMRVLMKHVNEAPPPVSVKNTSVEVPATIETFLRQALAKAPEARFPDVQTFQRALSEAMEAANTSGTASLPSLGTSAQGLRSITSDYDSPQPETARLGVDPTGETVSVDSRHFQEPIKEPPSKEVRGPTEPPGPETAAVLAETVRRKPVWWVLAAAVVILGVGVGMWRPWEDPAEDPPMLTASGHSSMDTGGDPVSTEEEPLALQPNGASTMDVVSVLPAPKTEETPELDHGVQEPDLSTAFEPPADIVVSTAHPLDADSGEDEAMGDSIVAPAAQTPVDVVVDDLSSGDDVDGLQVVDAGEAPPSAVATASPSGDQAGEKTEGSEGVARPESVLDESDRERKAEARRLRHRAEKAARERAAAKKAAAEKMARKKAAAEKAAAEKAAADKAAADKAADEKAMVSPGLGFRKLTVEKKTPDPLLDKPDDPKTDGGLGFRKLKVEDK